MKNRQDDLDDFEQEEDDVQDEAPRRRRRGGDDVDGEPRSWKREIRLALSVVTLLGGGLGGAGYWRYTQNQKTASPLQGLKDAAGQAEGLGKDAPAKISEIMNTAQQAGEQFGAAAQNAVNQAAQEADRYGQAATNALPASTGGIPARPGDIGPPDFDAGPQPHDRYATTEPPAASEPMTQDLGASAPPPMNNPFVAHGAAPAADAAPVEPAAAEPAAPTTAAANDWGAAPAPHQPLTPAAPNVADAPPVDVAAPPYELQPAPASSRRQAPAALPIETAPPATIPMAPSAPVETAADSDYRRAVPMTPAAPIAPAAPVSQAAPRPPVAAPAATYTVQAQDNYWAIAQKLYGNGGYFKALFEHNRDQYPRAKGLKAGDVISTPPTDVLAARYPDLLPANLKPTAASDMRGLVTTPGAATGPREYVVREGDTLFDIARFELGNAARWSEIYELNKPSLGENVDRLKPGTKLQLPGNDGSAMTFRRGNTRYQR